MRKQPIDIEEIDYMLLPELISDLETDFNMADSAKGEPLEILEFAEVIQAIEETVANCIKNRLKLFL